MSEGVLVRGAITPYVLLQHALLTHASKLFSDLAHSVCHLQTDPMTGDTETYDLSELLSRIHCMYEGDPLSMVMIWAVLKMVVADLEEHEAIKDVLTIAATWPKSAD